MKKDKYGHKVYGEFTQEERVAHRERIWSAKLRRDYGITATDYYRMFKNQGGVCCICGLESHNRKLAVDHNHTTGKVRGLLCQKCNLRLEVYEDTEFINKAEMYIKIHELRDKELLG